MKIYVLLQCSKKKNYSFSFNLIWSESSTIEDWNKNWEKSDTKYPVKDLYNGRSINKEFKLIDHFEHVNAYVISAGAGLVSLDEKIPSYDASFNSEGPSVENWFRLPHGGLEKIQINSEDVIVSFASPSYHRALINDPSIKKFASKLIVAHTSPLSKLEDVNTVEIHPRTAEFLDVASIDLNSELLRIYLENGISGFAEVYSKCELLPPIKNRTKISDSDLANLIEQLGEIKSISKTVYHIRHDLGISASYERIRSFIKK
tara:strand:- start:226 stop:1005 length:780 start_codon:yes stop_codon:yes gene_type:complete